MQSLLNYPLVALAEGLTELGALVLFGFEALGLLMKHGVRFRAVVLQMYAVGVRSLMTTVTAGLFVGAIVAIQINIQLKDFGAQSFLGGLSTSTTIRNVGPILIAFLLSGKVGAYTSAELGTMQVTEQINAIRCLGTNAIQYIILPRMIAVIISSFLLLIVGLMLTIAGGIGMSGLSLGVNPLNYIENIPQLVSGWSVCVGVIKSFVFGLLIALICCYKGYTAKGGAIGVGQTVKSTAVVTLVSIIVVDFTISILSGFIQDYLWLQH
jgi:phospholipid/cholesterol/gamma-HCH transport system permease protein